MPADEEVRRIAALLNAQLRSRKVTKRSIEQRMGWSHGYMTRLTSGAIELKLRHVFDILEMIGVSPAEFFLQAYGPESSTARLPSSYASFPVLTSPGAGRPAAAGPVQLMVVSEDELERRIETVIQRFSGRLAESADEPSRRTGKLDPDCDSGPDRDGSNVAPLARRHRS